MMSQRITVRAVLFDFDGTLADSYPAITASVNHVRSLHGLLALSQTEVRRHVGRGVVHLMGQTVPAGDLEANIAAYREHHPSVLKSGTHLFPGVAEVLRALSASGRSVGICSNKPVAFTRELIEILGIAAWVNVVLGPEDVARPKPAPDMLLAALQRLGVPAGEALYLGDMVVDIETARAAGVRVWVVPTGSEERDALERARPDRLLDALADLASLVVGKK
jgi:phosphoglycolate phosphatase